MISKKIYIASGGNNRFLSDFIIKSEQYARPYAFIYDETLAVDGTEDVLQNPSLSWSYPTNLWRRGSLIPLSEDLVLTDKWDVVDNSILFYTPPVAGTAIWIEVATTAEEFGDTLTQPAIEKAEAAVLEAQASRDAAAISATNASTSATNANTSATNASTSETNAATSATESAASAASIVGDRDAAEASALAAATSETNASASAIASAASASDAETNKDLTQTLYTNTLFASSSASGSATTATTKASEASVSATSASSSATASASSATASAASASSIVGDVASAETAATNAALSASLALDAQTAAETAEANAVLVSNVTKWVSGNTYTAGDVVWSPITYQTFRRKSDGAGTTDPSADATNWSRLTIDFALTAQPLISIASSVNESGTVQGTITNYDANATYTIWAGLGSISNISGNTFDFTAHNISNGLDTIDSIYIYAEKVGELQSETTTETINIIYVDIVADTAYQVVDFTGQASLNDGFDLI